MKASGLLCSFFLLIGSVQAQYKHFGVGLNVSTHNFTQEFLSTGLTFQYNTKYLLSFRTGAYVDRSVVESNSYFKVYNVDHYVTYQKRSYNNTRHLTIPLLAQITLGKKLYFTLTYGHCFSMLMEDPSVENEIIEVYPNSGQIADSYEEVVDAGSGMESSAMYAIGFAYPVHDRFLLSLEASSMQRLIEISSYNQYSAFNLWRFSVGLTYQLNFKKESSYRFANYSLKVGSYTHGK